MSHIHLLARHNHQRCCYRPSTSIHSSRYRTSIGRRDRQLHHLNQRHSLRRTPKTTLRVGPTHSLCAASGSISAGWCSQSSIHSGLPRAVIHCATATHPGPLTCGGSELPKVIQIVQRAVRVVAVAAKKPEISFAVAPTDGVFAASWNVGRRRCPLGAIHPPVDRIPPTQSLLCT